MEGSMIFCQKNILEHSLSFYGDYKKRFLLTPGLSQILSLTGLIPEIKYLLHQKDFSLQYQDSKTILISSPVSVIVELLAIL
jgi:hypothetical protein